MTRHAPRPLSRWSARACALALIGVTRATAAQDCPSPTDDSRESVAQELNLSGRHEDALEIFRALLQRCPSPRTLARLALTEAALGRWVSADQHLREALRAEHPWVTARRRELNIEAARILEHLGQLLISGDGPAGEVFLDDQPVGAWPMTEALRVPAGRVRVRIESSGFTPVERVVDIRAGILSREEVVLHRSAPLAPPSQPPAVTSPLAPLRSPAPTTVRTERGGAWRPLAWSTLGVGVAALTASAVLFATRGAAIDSLDEEGCAAVTAPVTRCDALADQADERGLIGAVTLAVGGALLAVSASAFVVSSQGRSQPRARWVCAPSLASAACALRF